MKRVYEVRLEGGRSHKKWSEFREGINELNGKSPDFMGVTSVAVIGTHHSVTTIRGIIGSGINGLTITEITRDNIDEPEFAIYRQTIQNAILPYGDYPALED